MRKWKYIGKHLPTGKVFERETPGEYTACEFARLVCRWNGMSPDWKYWLAKGEPMPHITERHPCP